MNPEQFEEMVRALRLGRPEAVEEFLRRYEQDLRRVIRIRLRLFSLTRTHDSVDVWQSILKSFFVRVQRGEFHFDAPQALHALLVKMADHKVLTYARAPAHRVGSLPPEWDVAVEHPSPLDRLIAEECVQHALALLPEDERGWLVERLLHDLKWKEIGQGVGKTADAVRVRVERALRLLRERLGEEG